MVSRNATALASALTLALTAAAHAGTGPMQSAGALAFDDGNVLFVGDSKAGVVRAFDFGEGGFDDQSDYALGRAQTFEGRTLIDGLDHAIAALLGVDAADITINDMAVHIQPALCSASSKSKRPVLRISLGSTLLKE
ncbi:MAG: hypothetical protein AAF460_18610, partial [Pseudomonadota bacterium]